LSFRKKHLAITVHYFRSIDSKHPSTKNFRRVKMFKAPRSVFGALLFTLALTNCSTSSAPQTTAPAAGSDVAGNQSTSGRSKSDGGLQELALAACMSGSTVESRKLRVVTTVAPITSIAANIAGDLADILGVVPEGTNSHTFEPPPSVAEDFTSADIVFVNGLSLEEPTKDLAKTNLPASATTCELGTATIPESEYIYDFSFPKEGGKPNPHLWTNPPMAKIYAQTIAKVFENRDPANAAAYKKNLSAFMTKVDALDNAFKTAAETIPQKLRALLTYHDAYAYFAKHYGWTVIGAIQPSSFDEPTPQDVVQLITQVKELGVKAIFGSEVFPSPILEQIGKETGVRYVDVLRDDDLPGTPGTADHSWLGLMKFDYITMIDALGGDSTVLKAVESGDVTKDTARYPQ
jgi:ABC-type Zn uptake system ZnuABC Zn-binding protein ZnuA